MVRSLAVAFTLMISSVAALATQASPAPSDTLVVADQAIVIHPVHHASFLLEWDDVIVAIDPVGDVDHFLRLGRPHLILVTHRHGDHLDVDIVRELAADHNVVISPPDVAEMIPACDPVALMSGDAHLVGDLRVTAVPAYNVTAERLAFHPPGRDNGYVLERDGARVYIGGDTEDIPELAAIGPVDAAFLPMNLPWTMSVEQAIHAARMVQPRVLYPYHHRNRDGTHADLDRLERELGPDIEVRSLAWY
jgi:L-ascorbate metabolism protein UlaG (beta-lactamase superfamily)